MSSTLIRNARLVNEGTIRESDLLIRSGRINRIGGDLPAPPDAEVVDANGALLLPGMIDDQVHFREPGLTHKACIATESRAGVAGGVTSFMEMPNTKPPTTTDTLWREKFDIASRDAVANHSFFFGATNDNIEAIAALDPATCCGVKVFMGSSTGNMLVDDEQTLSRIFQRSPVIIATHCESSPMIDANLMAALERYGPEIPVEEHPNIRSAEACYASTEQATSLAREHGADLHVLHLTTARELQLFDAGPVEDKHITCEVCIHHLLFDARDYPTMGNLIKCNPSVKGPEQRRGLLDGLAADKIDLIATDHAPHTLAEKASTDYRQAPAGLPLIQEVLLAALELHSDGELELTRVVEKTSHNVARRYRIRERGFLREGYWADLVLVDPDQTTTVSNDNALSRCGWTPFDGRQFSHRLLSTWVNGHRVYDRGELLPAPAGQALEFDREAR